MRAGQRWCRDPLRNEGEDQAGGDVQELTDLRVVARNCGSCGCSGTLRGSQTGRIVLINLINCTFYGHVLVACGVALYEVKPRP